MAGVGLGLLMSLVAIVILAVGSWLVIGIHILGEGAFQKAAARVIVIPCLGLFFLGLITAIRSLFGRR